MGYHNLQLEIAHHQIGASSSAISISLSANKFRIPEMGEAGEKTGEKTHVSAIGASISLSL